MKKFKYASDLAGLSGDDFINSLQGIKQAQMDYLSQGKLNENQAMGLSLLGINNLSDVFKGQSVTDIARKVFKTALSKSNSSEQELLTTAGRVQMVLGDAGKDMFLYLKQSNMQFDQLLNKAKKYILVGNDSTKQSKKINEDFRGMKIVAEELGYVFTGGFAKGLLPKFDMNALTSENQETRQKAISDLVGMTETLERILEAVMMA